MSDDTNLHRDRSAWLELHAGEVQHVIGADDTTAAEYWAEIEGTVAWAGFRLGRRLSELGSALRNLTTPLTEGEDT